MYDAMLGRALTVVSELGRVLHHLVHGSRVGRRGGQLLGGHVVTARGVGRRPSGGGGLCCAIRARPAVLAVAGVHIRAGLRIVGFD